MIGKFKKWFGNLTTGNRVQHEGKTLQILSTTPPEEVIWTVGYYLHEKKDHKNTLNVGKYYVRVVPCRAPSAMERKVMGMKAGETIYMESLYFHESDTLLAVVKKVEETALAYKAEGLIVNIMTPDVPEFAEVDSYESVMNKMRRQATEGGSAGKIGGQS